MKNRRSPEWKKLSEEEVHSVKDVGNIEFEYLNTLEKDATKEDSKALAFSFIALVIVGLGNKVFQKLQSVPMHNYPSFLNLLTTFIYIPLSFAYILPMVRYGKAITQEQQSISKGKFAVMGGLDSIAGIMQVFATTYLGGSLLILLSQAAIPISMSISRLLLQVKYNHFEYIGATIVTMGILIVLIPDMSSTTMFTASSHASSPLIWSVVMILSCIPMCLSSVYKEKALGETELDVVYLNGWIAIFQFLMSIPLALPAAAVGNPAVSPSSLPTNLWNGLQCYLGHNSIFDGDFPDVCDKAPLYTTIYIFFNVTYNILIILILKFGSANILWLASTIMVPLGNLAFAMPFMPEHKSLERSDIWGLCCIMLGLIIYRFMDTLKKKCSTPDLTPDRTLLKQSLLQFIQDEEWEA